ncbi:MAG TPA: hypothetical protein VF310_08760, partial [Vicinamibacteria bacterium]
MPPSLVTAVSSSVLCLLAAAAPLRAGVHASGTPFPSDRFTVLDLTQNTFRRVNLPKPPCAQRPSDCADIDVINTLDGFNLQPRLAIPFDGPIDVSTVTGQTVFLVRLGSTRPGGAPPGHIVGINQVVWDPVGFTLYAESDELLEQHTVYLLVVTSGVRDAEGNPVQAAKGFAAARAAELAAVEKAGFDPVRVVAASLFTTQSVTSTLEKVRAQIKAATPAPADFVLGSDGSRTVFPAAGITSILFQRQVTTTVFQPVPVPVQGLGAFPGAVGQVAFGRYRSPDYEAAGGFIPPTGTRSGVPAVQRTSDIYFTLFLPASPRPPQGWPVAIFGHGFGDNKNNSPFVVAATMANHGIATIAINVVGHGFGSAGTLTVTSNNASVTFSAGGRGFDQDGNTTIDSTEGSSAAPPNGIVGNRDGLR